MIYGIGISLIFKDHPNKAIFWAKSTKIVPPNLVALLNLTAAAAHRGFLERARL